MKRDPRPARGLALAVGLLASLAILAALVMGSLPELMRIAAGLSRGWAAAAAATAMAGQLAVGLALAEVLALLGYGIPLAESLGIGLVSTTANYLVSSAGLSGFALKAHLLRKRRIPYGITVTASVLTSAMLYLVLAAILAEGLVLLALNLRGTRFAVLQGALGLGLLLAVSVPLLAFLFNRRWRSRLARGLFHAVNRAAYLLSRSEIPPEDFDDFELQLHRGLERVRRHRGRLTRAVAYTCLDWGLTLLALYCSFRAVGVTLSVGHLVAAFAAGAAATLVPLLPGGLGAMEGAMAAVLSALGFDWERSLAACLVFRVVFHVLPGCLSVFVLWGLKVSEPGLVERARREAAQAGLGPPGSQMEKHGENS